MPATALPASACLPIRRRAAGFTLVELVMVITIIGILAAIALPRFHSLASQARAETLRSGEGAVKTALATILLKAQVAGLTLDSTVRQLDSGSGDMIDVINGHPACTANGIKKASGTDAGYEWTMSSDPTMCTLYPQGAYTGAFDRTNCGMVYDAVNGTTWGAVTSGC